MNHQNTSCGLTDNADVAKALCIATTRPQRLNTLREQSRRRNPIRNWSAIQANDLHGNYAVHVVDGSIFGS